MCRRQQAFRSVVWRRAVVAVCASFIVNGVGAATESAPAAVTLISPTASVTTRRPALVWNAQPGVGYYLVRVSERSITTDTWFTPAAAGCSSGNTCSVALGRDLDVGLVTWQALAWNPSGYSDWSER